ncbi:MAG: type II secretion system protein [Akkermansiaceae bacterium]|nr:type II secretion system protein [Armatimonadota bacterium]
MIVPIRTRKPAAFTMTELLVVITIIAMLVASLFPVFNAARRRGLRTTCLSNERQVGMALLQYTTEYDDHLFSPNGYTGWSHDAAYPFIKDVRAFRCPEDPTEDEDLSTLHASWDGIAYVNSYAINSNTFNESLGECDEPSRTVLLFEASNRTETFMENHRYAHGSSGGNGGRSLYCPTVTETGCKPFEETGPDWPLYATGKIGGRAVNGLIAATPRHLEGANYVAADGHAVWLRPEAVSGGDNQPTGGSECGQDDPAPVCAAKPAAAGTANTTYTLTFSIR